MKRIPESKVARWPQKITKLALMYACCFVLMCALSFSVCYAYFSSKVEATGSIAVGKLEIQYVDYSETESDLLTMIKRNGELMTDNDGNDLIVEEEGYTIIPGDELIIIGNVINTGDIDAYVLLQAEFMLMDESDPDLIERTFDSKFFNLSGTQITYDSTSKIYSGGATLLATEEYTDIAETNITYKVNTGLTSEYSGRTFRLRLTINALQSELLEEEKDDQGNNKYASLDVQATNMLLNTTPHLVTDAKIYGNSVQNIGNGKNLFSMYDFVEYQNGLVDAGDKGVSRKATIVTKDEKICLYTKASDMYGNGKYYYMPFNGATNTQYTISYKGYITQTMPEEATGNQNSGFKFYYSDGTSFSTYLTDMIGWQDGMGTTTSGKTLIGIGLTYNYAYMTYYTDIQLEMGSTATEYVPYAGKNILPLKDNLTQTINGVTMTIEDGEITLNGTASSNFQFGLHLNNGMISCLSGVIGVERSNNPLMYLEPGTYTQSLTYISGSVTGSGTKYYGLYTYKNGKVIIDQRLTLKDSNGSKSFTVTDRTEVQFFVIQVVALNNTITFDNLKFNVQLEYGSLATAYEPYVGAPSVNAPVKIESVGERTKNLFKLGTMDDYYVNEGQYSKNYFTIEDDKLVGLNKKDATGCLTTKEFYPYITGESYTFSFESNASETRLYVVVYNDSKENISSSVTISGLTYNAYYAGLYKRGKTLTFTTTDTNVRYFRVGFISYDPNLTIDVDYIMFYNIQIEKGTAKTEFEPYGYKIDVTARGKNLLNIHQNYASISNCTYDITGETLTITPTGDKLTRLVYELKLEKNTNYVISGKYEMFNSSEYVGGSSLYIREGSDGGTVIASIDLKAIDGQQDVLLRFNSGNYTSLYFWYYYNSQNDGTQKNGSSYAVYKNIQIEKGSTPTEYEQYIGNQTHTIYLDQPLRKVGDVADYIEIKDGIVKVVRNVGEYVVTGNEDWLQFSTATTYYTTAITDAKYASDVLCISNKYQGKKSAGGSAYSNTSAWFQSVDTYKRFYLSNSDYESLEDFKAYLKDQYNKGDFIIIQYVLANSKETIIDISDMFTLSGDTIYEFSGTIAPSDYYFS